MAGLGEKGMEVCRASGSTMARVGRDDDLDLDFVNSMEIESRAVGPGPTALGAGRDKKRSRDEDDAGVAAVGLDAMTSVVQGAAATEEGPARKKRRSASPFPASSSPSSSSPSSSLSHSNGVCSGLLTDVEEDEVCAICYDHVDSSGATTSVRCCGDDCDDHLHLSCLGLDVAGVNGRSDLFCPGQLRERKPCFSSYAEERKVTHIVGRYTALEQAARLPWSRCLRSPTP